jgi:hypothetical protein
MTYAEWGAHHARLYGLTLPQQLETVRSWLRVLEAGGYTPEELRAASEWLLTHDAPRFLGDTPAALVRRIRDARSQTILSSHAANAVCRCQDCAGGGLLSVPDLRTVREGKWLTGHTCAVRCLCERGVMGNFFRRDGVQVMSLQEYEQHNPQWQTQMAQRAREDRELAAIDRPGPLDEAIQRIQAHVSWRRARPS